MFLLLQQSQQNSMDGSTFANTSIEAPLYCAEQIKVPEALPVSGNAIIYQSLLLMVEFDL